VEPLENNVSPEHPLAEMATLLAGLALAGLALLGVAWLAVEGAVRWLPVSVEQRVFGADVEESDAPALASLLDRLASHWPENEYALAIGIVEADEPNAFALPGGQLLVTSALLEQADSENELAFVLGHELGHLAGRDPLRALGRGLLVSLVLGALGGAEGASVAATAAALGERRFSREQERAADRFALALVAAEYGHVAGAVDFLRRQADAAEPDAAARAVSWLSTHPLSAERAHDLERLAGEHGWPTEGALVPLPPELQPD
jgi:Zn-dependent protease with chaperone function